MITVTLTDDSGAALLSMGSDASGLLLNTFDLGYPTAREVAVPASGMDGDDDVTQFTGPRAIVAEVTFPATGVGPLMDVVRGLMHPGRRYWLQVARDDWSAPRQVQVRGASLALKSGSLPVTAQLGWKAPKPNLQDTTVSSATISPSAQPSGGMSFPVSLPMSFDPGLAPGATILTVGGTVNVAPVIDIYGPCSGPVFRVVDTGQQLSFSGLSLGAGDYLHIDVAARSITLNGDPAQARYDRLDFATSSWPVLPPGSPEVLFSPASSSSPCVAVVSWRSSWA